MPGFKGNKPSRDEGGGCRRCSRCSIHYPTAQRYSVCEVCGEETSFFSNVDADPEWEEAVRYAKMQPPPTRVRDPHTMRFESYLKMGFNEDEAQSLAMARYGKIEIPLYHGIVKKALDSGCSHALALDMFT